MSYIEYEGRRASLARLAEMETVFGRSRQSKTHLVLDGSDTNGTMSVNRAELGVQVPGPGPHNHKRFSELIYVCSGALDVLAGDKLLTLHGGDAVVVPPLMPHAFSATAEGGDVDVLVVGSPGMDRFEYFREISNLTEFPPPLDFQERYDNYFLESDVWMARSNWDRR
jgi:mannose-6-phosphate isomerase-like protein (cupin superfamily)